MGSIKQVDGQVAWGSAATCWEFLAVSLRLPDAVSSNAVASGEWGQAGLEVAAALGLGDDESLRRDLLDPLGRADGAQAPEVSEALHALRAEYTRLFVYTPEAEVSPYESVWFAKEKGIEPMLYVNRAAMEVERFCKRCGLGRPAGTNEPLEHIATECELLEYLAVLACGGTNESAEVEPSYPGGSPAAAYGEFLAGHGAWMPVFAAELAAKTRLPFYRATAKLLSAMAAA